MRRSSSRSFLSRSLALISVVAATAVVTAVSAPVSSATPVADPASSGSLRQQIQQMVDTYVTTNKVPGVSLAVVKPNALGTHADTLYVTSGVASKETKEPVTRLTQFEIASESKTYSGGLLAYLVSTGRVHLDDPLQKFAPPGVTVPVWSENGVDTPITLRDLVTHQSGFPRDAANELDGCPASDPYCSNYKSLYTETMMWDFIKHFKLHWKPGTNWMYSNFASGVLGTVLANVMYPGQQPPAFQQALNTAYLNDLRLRATLVEVPSRRLAAGYDQSGDPAPWLFDTNALAAEGGIISDATDMGTWVAASLGWDSSHHGIGVSSLPDAVKPISTITKTCDDFNVDKCKTDHFTMGMAWQLYDASQSGYGVPIAYKDGSNPGFATVTLLAPDQKVGVTVLSNLELNDGDDFIDPLTSDILKLVLTS